ncbi:MULTISPECIES: WYL domain-containing protein [Streptomyces]|uniref:WYL domain-containing protein n=1 Tax=Streptomyces TaxID=1883 RepID=UPI001F278029|nr:MULTISPECIES: WYL domain-containing protein [Streptomyces]WQG71161.1 WYL domain-containing protein [Streptomyces albidoflavus]
MCYRRWRELRDVRRRLRPLSLVLKSGTWYVVAADLDRIATYRVSQILDATPSSEHFDRPPAFDLATHWAAYQEEFRSRRQIGTATVRLSPMGRARLPDHVDPEIPRAVEATAAPPGPDGWTKAVILTGHTCAQLLRLGTDIEVLAPTALREAMGRAARGWRRCTGGSWEGGLRRGPRAPSGPPGWSDEAESCAEPMQMTTRNAPADPFPGLPGWYLKTAGSILLRAWPT